MLYASILIQQLWLFIY